MVLPYYPTGTMERVVKEGQVRRRDRARARARARDGPVYFLAAVDLPT